MSLKRILDYRRYAEESARVELAIAARELELRLEAVRRLEGEIGRLLGEIARREREGVAAGEVLDLYRFADALASDLSSGRRLVVALSAQCEQKKDALVAAARDRRIVEILEDRRGCELSREEERREQRAGDETGLRCWRGGDNHVAPKN